jgi:predicted glycosyltransferase
LYDGVEEIAWLRKPFAKRPEFLEELRGKDRVILFRNVEYKASYFKDVKVDVWKLVEELSKLATVVYLPRYEEEREKLKHLKNIWIPPKPALTFQILPYVDLVVASGGTICREAALMGVPTISFHFWDTVAKYLSKRKFPIRCIMDINKILTLTKKILKNPQKYKVDGRPLLNNLESPITITVQCIKEALKKE